MVLDDLLAHGWPEDKRRAGIATLVALTGDVSDIAHARIALDALRLLLAYAYGKPTEYHDVEQRIHIDWPRVPDDVLVAFTEGKLAIDDVASMVNGNP